MADSLNVVYNFKIRKSDLAALRELASQMQTPPSRLVREAVLDLLSARRARAMEASGGDVARAPHEAAP